MNIPIYNIRHNLDPALVQAQIDKKVCEHIQHRNSAVEYAKKRCEEYTNATQEERQARWISPPESHEIIEAIYNKWIEREKNHYTFVRVIELPKKGNRFILVYGDADDATVKSGTGPFKTCQEAMDWFLKSGR